MRPRYRSKLPYYNNRPDLTALVDVLFLLLIFFMLSSSFVQVSGIPVELPKVNTHEQADIEKFIVSIASTGGQEQLYFNDRPVTEDALKQQLADVGTLSRSATIILRADAKVSFETVTRIMTLAKRAELTTFITVMPEERGDAAKKGK